jgi:hypothetical protein
MKKSDARVEKREQFFLLPEDRDAIPVWVFKSKPESSL